MPLTGATDETATTATPVAPSERSAAWLDVRSTAGGVHNALDAADAPGAAETLEVRARTHLGDIVIARPAASAVNA